LAQVLPVSRWHRATNKRVTDKRIQLVSQQKLFLLRGQLRSLTSATFTDSVADYPDRPGEKLPTYGFSDYMFNGARYTFGVDMTFYSSTNFSNTTSNAPLCEPGVLFVSSGKPAA
jgi:hypothetical protein